jgi:hypothetical protein
LLLRTLLLLLSQPSSRRTHARRRSRPFRRQ